MPPSQTFTLCIIGLVMCREFVGEGTVGSKVDRRFSRYHRPPVGVSLCFSWRRRSSSYETPSLPGFSVTWAQAATWTCAWLPRPEWSTCEATTSWRPEARGERPHVSQSCWERQQGFVCSYSSCTKCVPPLLPERDGTGSSPGPLPSWPRPWPLCPWMWWISVFTPWTLSETCSDQLFAIKPLVC